ncbi:uncharacterized protein LOC143293988 [Babylonia areolata]|uniref:uncharacterized protein LOC143293988 n=1 Tax=Babylonia areolata TaxID=304850 RepID=UPI003FD6B7AF
MGLLAKTPLKNKVKDCFWFRLQTTFPALCQGVEEGEATTVTGCQGTWRGVETDTQTPNLDSVPTTYQEAEPLPHNMPQEATEHQVARQDPRHRGARKSHPSQHLHHPDAVPASLGWTRGAHARPSAAQKALLCI